MSAPVFSHARPTAHDRLHWFAWLTLVRSRTHATALLQSLSRRHVRLAGQRLADALRAHEMWTPHVAPPNEHRRKRQQFQATRRWLAVWSPHLYECTLPACRDCNRIANRWEAIAVLEEELKSALEVPGGH